MNAIDFGDKYPLCDGQNLTDIRNAWNEKMNDLTNTFKCKVIPKCKKSIYEASYEPTLVRTGFDSAIVKIQLASPSVQFIEDSYNYDAQSFIGEVGGTMGLLLGLSFLSLFDFIDSFLTHFSRKK